MFSRIYGVVSFNNRINEFINEANTLKHRVINSSTKDVIDELSRYRDEVIVERYTSRKYLVRDKVMDNLIEDIKKGIVWASLFNDYRFCARKMIIKIEEYMKHGGLLVGEDQLKAIVSGVLIHKLYDEKYAVGETEYPVTVINDKYRIAGRIDEYIPGDKPVIVEIKTGHHPDIFSASLQVTAYILAVKEEAGVEPDAYIVTLGNIYYVTPNWKVFDEYYKRLKTILSLIGTGDYPPRLSGSVSSRCNSCPYRGICYKLPDNYRSWDKFFEKHGFTRLKKKTGKTLFDYS